MVRNGRFWIFFGSNAEWLYMEHKRRQFQKTDAKSLGCSNCNDEDLIDQGQENQWRSSEAKIKCSALDMLHLKWLLDFF